MSDEIEVKGRYPLTREWIKQELIRELADGRKSQTELAERYGVGQSGIAEFKRRHITDIQRVRDSLTDEWVGVWAADKRNRLLTLQSQVEDLLDSKTTARSAETVDRLLRSIAEELGDITNKNKIEVESYRYEIVGINLEDLQ